MARSKTTKPSSTAAARPKQAPTSPVAAGKLQTAVKANRIDEVRTLLDQGVDPDVLVKDSSTLAVAVYWGHEPIVKLLLEHRANPNLGTSFPAAGGAMHAAASRARLAMLPLLLEHGGDPNAAGQNNHRPLQSAIEGLRPAANEWGPEKPARAMYVAMVRALIDAGARPELEDTRRNSAWTAAIRSDDPEIFELIAATDPARVTRDGQKWLDEAAMRGSKLIDVLVKRGVSVAGNALHIAAQCDNVKAIERLLAHGADPAARIGDKSALETAKQHGSSKAARLLKQPTTTPGTSRSTSKA